MIVKSSRTFSVSPITLISKDISRRHEFVSLLELGQTHEGRRILGVRVGRGELGGDTPTVLLDGGMHAREWITVATALNCEHTLRKCR